ncbi:hypothetical protein A0256_23495 [Mucilaginibacter sp. PAMC 26640]|nr:hypothetical protein A0256_23495 [Mucilaginibacter sp. PAMC 26640]
MTDQYPAVKAWIIDDDEIFIFGFKKFIEIRRIFVELFEFSNGQAAISQLQDPAFADNLPDLIFVDMNMPVMDGWEFTKTFEEIKSRLGKDITVYMISSSVDKNDIARAKNIRSIEDYILKPISQSNVEGIINSFQHELELRNMN